MLLRKKSISLAEQQSRLSPPREVAKFLGFCPLLSKTTGARIREPVAVACRPPGFCGQAFYPWPKQELSAREVEERYLIEVLRGLYEDGQSNPSAG